MKRTTLRAVLFVAASSVLLGGLSTPAEADGMDSCGLGQTKIGQSGRIYTWHAGC